MSSSSHPSVAAPCIHWPPPSTDRLPKAGYPAQLKRSNFFKQIFCNCIAIQGVNAIAKISAWKSAWKTTGRYHSLKIYVRKLVKCSRTKVGKGVELKIALKPRLSFLLYSSRFSSGNFLEFRGSQAKPFFKRIFSTAIQEFISQYRMVPSRWF